MHTYAYVYMLLHPCMHSSVPVHTCTSAYERAWICRVICGLANMPSGCACTHVYTLLCGFMYSAECVCMSHTPPHLTHCNLLAAMDNSFTPLPHLLLCHCPLLSLPHVSFSFVVV